MAETTSDRTDGPLSSPTEIKKLREAFGAFATGVTVLTTGGPAPHGMTANSFSSVSLDPPLVLVCVDRSAVMHRTLAAAGSFGISVLASHQESVARHFANRRRPLGIGQFEGIRWRPGRRTGAPMIEDAVAHFECDLWRSYDGGDHTIFLGRLLSLAREPDESGLLFCHGRFHRLDPEPRELSA
ncbi:flavin reductase family protein [Actinomadura sp. 7K534]|uniref:flavin reductase family protein n=1 Tax=Actinomadura sp. 7K534 TaxID=2530366 RepID=UPI00104E8468|nr:flavin reductase family protein [Actinomadura sp. 7K534]TDB98901.1 flavin reductase [Actinomadura sp. 7K534]